MFILLKAAPNGGSSFGITEGIIVAVIVGVVTIITEWIKRPSKAKKEQKQEVVTSMVFKRIQESLGLEISRLEDLTKINKAEISKNEKKIELLTRQNELCEYQHEVNKLEMDQIKILTGLPKIVVDKVYVVDDDEDDLLEFKERFSSISVIAFLGFLKIDDFVEAVKRDKPTVVIMDYKMPPHTADQFLDKFGYDPEVFIVSGELVSTGSFNGRKVRFFLKEKDYAFKVAIAVIQYLKEVGLENLNKAHADFKLKNKE